MKIKADFVTNSSSASFVMTLRSVEGDLDVDEMKEKINRFIEYFRDHYSEQADGLRYWDGVQVERLSTGIFEVREWTSMYNYPNDIPAYMQIMMFENYLGDDDDLSRFGFKVEKFKIEHD